MSTKNKSYAWVKSKKNLYRKYFVKDIYEFLFPISIYLKRNSPSHELPSDIFLFSTTN